MSPSRTEGILRHGRCYGPADCDCMNPLNRPTDAQVISGSHGPSYFTISKQTILLVHPPWSLKPKHNHCNDPPHCTFSVLFLGSGIPMKGNYSYGVPRPLKSRYTP